MISTYDMTKVDIPYGILHDQKLKGVKCENNKMIFTFDIAIYPEDYTNDYYKQFVEYNHCDMIVELCEEPFNYYNLQSCPNNKGRFKGLSLNRNDFLNAINNTTSATFIECSAACREFTIELAVSWKNGRYKKYSLCYATLDAVKVEWKWY